MPLGKFSQLIEIAANQGFLFRAGPALHLPFGCNCVGDLVEPLGKDHVHRSTLCGVTVISSCVVFGDALLKTRTGRARDEDR